MNIKFNVRRHQFNSRCLSRFKHNNIRNTLRLRENSKMWEKSLIVV